MTEISPSGAALFFAAVALVFVGVLISIIELLAAWRFAPWAFRLGPRILQLKMVLPRPVRSATSNEPRTTSTGRYKVVSTEECLFRPRQFVFGPRLRTPFPIRGVIRWLGAEAQVEGRLPVGGLLAYAAWLIGITIWCALVWRSPRFAALAPWILLGGWVFAGVICWWSIWYELKRARRILTELTEALEHAAA